MTAKEACLDAVKRVARNFNNDRSKLEKFDLNFYAIRKDGDYGSAALWTTLIRDGKVRPSRFAVNDGGESRLEACVCLLDKK
jgi:N4-(beta-N-acetylglucosaminyl)-L-asparaginase